MASIRLRELRYFPCNYARSLPRPTRATYPSMQHRLRRTICCCSARRNARRRAKEAAHYEATTTTFLAVRICFLTLPADVTPTMFTTKEGIFYGIHTWTPASRSRVYARRTRSLAPFSFFFSFSSLFSSPLPFSLSASPLCSPSPLSLSLGDHSSA